MGGDFTLRWASAPFAVQLISVLVCLGLAMMTRGPRLLRAGTVFVMVAALPYSITLMLNGSVDDPAVAEKLLRFGVGSVPLVGVALMMALLTTSGRFEQHRLVFAIALVTASISAIVAVTSDLVVTGTWRTSWGMWFNIAGPMTPLHVGQFAGWTIVGIVLSRRGTAVLLTERQQGQVKLVIGGLVLALICSTDALLGRQIGVYPFSFIPACIGLWVTTWAILRQDLFQSQGFDWGGLYELLVVAGLAVVTAIVLVVSANAGPPWSSALATAILLSPALLIAYVVALIIRARVVTRWRAEESQANQAIELFFEQASAVSSRSELADKLSTVLVEHLALREPRLYLQDESGMWAELSVDADRPFKLDARVRAWLMSNRTPLIVAELFTIRLGGLRKPIEAFMTELGVDLVLPLVDRDRLVGLVVATGRADDRALRDGEKMDLELAGQACARALTYIELMQDAEEKMEVVREVEVATAVQQARTPGEQTLRFGNHEIISFYQPSKQFGGHWWMTHQLPDGRLLIVIGDVTGHGVSAALISFTVEGACETANRMFGANFELLALLQLLNRSVLEVGQGAYAMSCFAAIVDPDDRNVVFANAGHPFPYVCRHADNPRRGNAELRALVSRGTPLGTPDPVLAVSNLALENGDLLVFFSDSVVSSRNPEGQAYGDRRLQRVLRTKVRDAGNRACQVIMHDAKTFYGNQPVDEDLSLVVLRLGAA